MKRILKNIFGDKEQNQRTVSIDSVLNDHEYIAKDSTNRKYRVQSDQKWKTGDIVVIQGMWIIGRGRKNKKIKVYSI